jgi:hypothetical protein
LIEKKEYPSKVSTWSVLSLSWYLGPNMPFQPVRMVDRFFPFSPGVGFSNP